MLILIETQGAHINRRSEKRGTEGAGGHDCRSPPPLATATTSVSNPRDGGERVDAREDASFAGRGTGWRAERNILG